MAATEAFTVQSDGGFAGAGRALAITLKSVQMRLVSEKPGDKGPEFGEFADKTRSGRT